MVRCRLIPACALLLVFWSTAASAQSAGDLEARLNHSDFCTPLKFDAVDVARLLGYSIPDIPLKVEVGWDKNSHTVARFTVDAGRKLEADLQIGCEPGPTSAGVLELLDLEPKELRLSDTVICAGTVGADGVIAELVCKPTDKIGRILARITDLSGQLKPIFQTALPKP